MHDHAPLLLAFLDALTVHGQLTVTPRPDFSPFSENIVLSDPALVRALRRLDALARLDAPGPAPDLHLPAAAWATLQLHRICQFILARSIGYEQIIATFSRPCPGPLHQPSVHWSADLLLRHLPSLHGIARRLSADDPLVQAILDFARPWPLSSLGLPVPAPAAADLAPVLAHPTLLRLSADRLIRHSDLARLGPPALDAALAAALGLHTRLHPALSAALRRQGRPEPDFQPR